MLLCASKKMAALLNKEYRGAGITFDYIQMGRRNYEIYVDSRSFNHDNDYLIDSDKFRVIRINYPAECYAAAQYITTNLLFKCWKDAAGVYSEFLNVLQDYIFI